MKWMSMDQRAEWNALLDEALDSDATTYPLRAALVLDKLRDAEQAHRPWAAKIINDAIIAGLSRSLRSRSDARNRILVVLPKGRRAERKARRGVRSLSADGTIVHQQKLIDELTWAEVAGLISDLESQIASLSDSRTMVRRLFALRDQVPDSTGPGDAARQLGLTVEAYLEAA